MNLNKVMLIGNLCGNPELRFTPSGSAVTQFSMAMNRKYKSGEETKQETCFVEIVIWGKQAESASKYLQKGSSCFIEGRLQQDTWVDKESGKNRSKLKVIAERVQFLDRKPENGAQYDPHTPHQPSCPQGRHSQDAPRDDMKNDYFPPAEGIGNCDTRIGCNTGGTVLGPPRTNGGDRS